MNSTKLDLIAIVYVILAVSRAGAVNPFQGLRYNGDVTIMSKLEETLRHRRQSVEKVTIIAAITMTATTTTTTTTTFDTTTLVNGTGVGLETDKEGLDPIIVLSIVIGVCVLLILVTSITLLILLRSKCTLSPPEPTLLNYLPHFDQSMETSFSIVDDDNTSRGDPTCVANHNANLSPTNNDNADQSEVSSSARESQYSSPYDNETITSDKTQTFAARADAVVNLPRPRPRPKAKTKRRKDPSKYDISMNIPPPERTSTLKSNNSNPTSKITNQFDQIKDMPSPDSPQRPPVILRRERGKTVGGAVPYDGNNTLERNLNRDDDDKTLAEIRHVLERGIDKMSSKGVTNPETRTRPKSELIMSGKNPFDEMTSVLISMSRDEECITPSSFDMVADHYTVSYDDLTLPECDHYNGVRNPTFLSSNTDTRVVSYLNSVNESNCRGLMSSDSNIMSHTGNPSSLNYPVFFTQSCPNTPLFERKDNCCIGCEDTIEYDEIVDNNNTQEVHTVASSWKSETHLILENKLNGLSHVYLRPAMDVEQLPPAFRGDQWEESRTTF